MSLIFSLLLTIFSRPTKTIQAGEKGSNDKLTVVDKRTNKTYDIPIVNNAVRAIDFRYICTLGITATALERFNAGLRVFDPGYQNTAVVESEITHIDGLKGTIHYRGFTMDHLIDNHDFEEVAFLLIWGHLPDEKERLQFRRNLAQLATPPELVVQTIKAFPRDTSYHLLFSAAMTAWTATDPSMIPVQVGKELYLGKMEFVDEALQRCVAAIMTVTALVYCHQQGRDLTPPRPDVSLVENSLIMMGLVDKSTNRPSPRMLLFLNRLWILYADHEMTNSTAAGLHCSSTLADPMTSCIASVCAGSGPLHAGAINIAYKSFERIGTKDKVPAVIADVKAKKYRLFGYGHRIYKTVDPRVKHLRKMLNELASEVENDPYLKVAMEIDRIASTDTYFTSRNLKVNADLYGCFVFSAMGFKPEIITCLMQAARGVGMLAHWRETMTKPANLWRPLQIFTGKQFTQ